MTEPPMKPLGQKAYGHIPHLPGSRRGPGDHKCPEGQARICTEKIRDRHDLIIVQEKLDGSCVAVAKIGGEVVALGRSGYLAQTSKYEQHQLFSKWVRDNEDRFRSTLFEGERICGEWLAQAHGTRYDLPHEPFVAFDIMSRVTRLPYSHVEDRLGMVFTLPKVLHIGGPFPIERAMELVVVSGHGALDLVEGAVWRVQRRGVVDFLAKYVRPDKQDGCYLPEVSGGSAIWNWRPS